LNGTNAIKECGSKFPASVTPSAREVADAEAFHFMENGPDKGGVFEQHFKFNFFTGGGDGETRFLSVAMFIKEFPKSNPALVVSFNVNRGLWMEEFEKMGLRALHYDGTQTDFSQYDVVICVYGRLRDEYLKFHEKTVPFNINDHLELYAYGEGGIPLNVHLPNVRWSRFFMDQADSFVENPQTNWRIPTFRVMRLVEADARFALTWLHNLQNIEDERYALFTFLRTPHWSKLEFFKKAYSREMKARAWDRDESDNPVN
jgi:hypothetical protein